MEAIQNTQQSAANQNVSQKSAPTTTADGDGGFDDTLSSLSTSETEGSVSEEDLFAALVQQRIKNSKGDEALASFQELFSEAKSSMTKADGYVPMEDAAKSALIELRDQGVLTADETDSIYSEAFDAAQLDNNTDALYDARGGANDTTIAVATLEQALLACRVKIEGYDSGDESAPLRSISEASAGKSLSTSTVQGGSASGFLFKPVSDSDGKLAVLLPPAYSGLVTGMRLIGPDGQILETGRYAGNGNGGREHFRFSKSGSSYPDGLTVEATLSSGETLRYVISDTSARTEDPSVQTGPATQTGEASISDQSPKSGDSRATSTKRDTSDEQPL